MVFMDVNHRIYPTFSSKTNLSTNLEIEAYFIKSLKQKTGVSLLHLKSPISTIHVFFTKENFNKKETYRILLKKNTLTISAATLLGFKRAIDYLCYHIFTYPKQQVIIVPSQIDILRTPDFNYREVYFSDNFKSENRKKYATHYLENQWGLWGHNLKKIIKNKHPSDSIYALIKGRRIKNQFCFSSKELLTIVKQHVLANSDKEKFIIAPNDNHLVCQCELCKTVGNSKNDASSSVFSFLNKLSKEFSTKEFWTLGYASVNKPPSFQIAKNVGVFLSTINCQESLPFKTTQKGQKFLKKITFWKTKIRKIYLWDYVVNFDNYLEYYPILKATQQNLKSFKENGVTGIFLQGSGYDYSFLQEIKYDILSQLLWDSHLNIDLLLKKSLQEHYPKTYLTWYSLITKLEDITLKNNYKQSIYNGLLPITKNHLSLRKISNLKKNAIKNKNLCVSLQYLELELIRYQGFINTSFVSIKKNRITLKPTLLKKVKQLRKLVQQSTVNVINERRFTLKNYIKNWQKTFNYYKKNPSFYKFNISSPSKLDEDYTALKLLNDGSLGFEDYSTNWLIYSGKEFILQLDLKDQKQFQFINIGFLNDPNHHIYLPSKIMVFSNDKLVKSVSFNTETVSKVIRKKIALDSPISSHKITLKIYHSNRSIAIDEIQFLR